MEQNGKWLADRAKKAEKNLKSVPKEKLGPAGKTLVSSPLQGSPSKSRSTLRGVDGGQAERPAASQLPLARPVIDT